MPSTLTGAAASATQSTAPTASVPADGDSLAASGVQGPFQTILNHIAKLWAGAFAAIGTNPALQATGSATRAPLNIVPQAAPSAPGDGDVWVETGSNQVKARVAGGTQTLTAVAATAALGHGDGTATYIQPAIPNGSTWVTILGHQRAFSGTGATATTTTGAIQVASAGTYAVNFAAQGGADSTSGGQYQFRVLKNGTTALMDPWSQMNTQLAANGGFTAAGAGRVVLAANDSLVMQIMDIAASGARTPRLASVSFTVDRLY